MWRVHLPVNDDGDEGKKATTVVDRSSGRAMHLAEESPTRKLGIQPLLGTASRGTNQPDSVTPAVTGVCASSFTLILFVVHMCTLL